MKRHTESAWDRLTDKAEHREETTRAIYPIENDSVNQEKITADCAEPLPDSSQNPREETYSQDWQASAENNQTPEPGLYTAPLDASGLRRALDLESSGQAPPQPELQTLEQAISEDDQDDGSASDITSNTADSVFSAESSDTLATAFSADSGFSAQQIQSATRVFLAILQENKELTLLCDSARSNKKTGIKRLRREIRENLKAYAENLKEEAYDHLEFAACRLVRVKARYVAQYIASGEDRYRQSQYPINDRNRTTKLLEDSSDEEPAEPSVDETEFRDLKAFRQFLTTSAAYAKLEAQIHLWYEALRNKPAAGGLKDSPSMTSPSQLSQSMADTSEEKLPNRNHGTPLQLTPATGCNTKLTWHIWQEDASNLAASVLQGFNLAFLRKAVLFLLVDIVLILTDDVFIATGCLEPRLKAGWTRIRSECVGLSLDIFSD